MDKELRRRLEIVNEIVSKDLEYQDLIRQVKNDEDRVYDYELGLTRPLRDAMWDYLGSCSELESRRLVLACMNAEKLVESDDGSIVGEGH